MKKIEVTDNGYYYAKVTNKECLNWGGLSVCDLCGEPFNEGYLVFVLGSCICPKCFNSWLKTSKRYEEDLHIQQESSEGWFEYHLGTDIVMPKEYIYDKVESINAETSALLDKLDDLNKNIDEVLPEIFPELNKEEDNSVDI